ncbi:MAG TPA: 6-phosphogluconolactonase [Terriglobales bacterium]|nr:6-phosphogluconolactonase [Terriglobales bacterium]
MSSPPDIRIFAETDALFRAAAEQFSTLTKDAVKAKDSFSVALSGGSTPKGLYTLLAESYRDSIHWDKIYFFWGDERPVPPDSPESNYRMAYETLLSKVPVPSGNIFRIHSEKDPQQAAITYEQTLSTAFRLPDLFPPRFDLILLGLGSDGHTASLFPHTRALKEDKRFVVANRVEKLDTCRITLTLPVLNNAAHVIFLAAGKDKTDVLASVLDASSPAEQFPAKLVRPRNGSLTWMVDSAAAAKLKVLAPQA